MNVLISLVPIVFDRGKISVITTDGLPSKELDDRQPIDICADICTNIDLRSEWLDIKYVGCHNSDGTLTMFFSTFVPQSYAKTQKTTENFREFSEIQQEAIQTALAGSFRKV